jgi:predicted metal-dependent hydrolase
MAPGVVAYRLRVSPRARRVWLRVSPAEGLVVVVPKRFDVARIPGVLAREGAWIRRALARAERQRASVPSPSPWEFPREITLPAIGMTWPVSCRPTDAPHVRVAPAAPTGLQVTGQVGDGEACRAALGRWLVRQARIHLLPRLEAVSRRLALRYTRAGVRLQRTRWASCSPDRAISLNGRLLLLPPPLVEYVFVHELCHTLVMNHSKKFWRMVERHCPDYRQLRRDLRAAGKRLPAWADGDHGFCAQPGAPEGARDPGSGLRGPA